MGMNYGQPNMQGGMASMSYPPGMNQQQGWMGGQMMGNYGYGNQNFSTAYPQSYGNQGYGWYLYYFPFYLVSFKVPHSLFSC